MADIALNQSAIPLRGQAKPQPGSNKARRLHVARHSLNERIDYLNSFDMSSKQAIGVLATKIPCPTVPDAPGVLTFNFFKPPSEDAIEEEEEDVPLEKVPPLSDDTEPVINVTKKKDKVKKETKPQPLSKKQRRKLKKSATKSKRKATVATPESKPVAKKQSSSPSTDLAEKLRDTSVLQVFLDRLNSGDTTRARRFLRSVFNLDSKQSLKDYDMRLTQMNKFISDNAERMLGDSLVLEDTAYGVASPDAYLPTPLMSDAEWDEHDGPLTDEWDGEPYRISQMYEEWNEVVNSYPQYIGMRKRMFVRRIHANYMAWLELHTDITTKTGRPLATMLGGDDDIIFVTREHYRRNEAVMIGGLKVGVKSVAYSALIPSVVEDDSILAFARTFSSTVCRQLCDNMYWPPIKPMHAANDEGDESKPYQNVLPWKTEPIVTVAAPIVTVTNDKSFLRPELQAERRRERVISDLTEAERCRIRQELVRLPSGKYTVKITTHPTDYVPVLASTPEAEQVLTQSTPTIETNSEAEGPALTGAQTYFNMYGNRPEEKKTAMRLIAELMEEAYAMNRVVDTGLWMGNAYLMEQWRQEVDSLDQYAYDSQLYDIGIRIQLRNEGRHKQVHPVTAQRDEDNAEIRRWIQYWMDFKPLNDQDMLGWMDGKIYERPYHRLWPELTEQAKIRESQAIVDAMMTARSERERNIKVSELHKKSNEIGMVAKTKSRKRDPYCVGKPATVSEWRKGKAPVTSKAGISVAVDKPTDLSDADKQVAREKGVLRDIMEASEDNFIYAKKVTDLLKQPVVNLHKVREIADRFTKNEGGILVPT